MADAVKLVPCEPTREMWAAGGTAACQTQHQHHDAIVEAVWSAMLAASPPAREEAPAEKDWRGEYNRVEAIRDAAEGQDRIARSTTDPMAKSDAETQAAGHWSRYEREVAKLNKEAPTEGAGERDLIQLLDQIGSGSIFPGQPTTVETACRKASAALRNRTSEPEAGEAEYVSVFYEIAEMLGIGARASSPASVWLQEMKPALQRLITTAGAK